MLLTALLLAMPFAACRGRERNAGEGSAIEETPDAAPAGSEPANAPDLVLLFPSPDDEFLHVEKRHAILISAPEERAAQCLEELFRGPSPGLLAAAPDGVHLRQVFILPDGTAWVDLSPEVLKLAGGSAAELQTIYAIVDTLALNVPPIQRTGILVDGEPRETLAGHISLARPLEPDYTYLDAASRPSAQNLGLSDAQEGVGAGGDGSAGEGATEPDASADEDGSSGPV